MTKNEEMAIQQFVGYSHGSKGYDLPQLIESMALTRKEFQSIRDDIKSWMLPRDFAEVEEYFNK